MTPATIIWINGAFGSGKTTVAYTLHRRLTHSFVFDPEQAGYYLRKNQPAPLCLSNFQDEPLWRQINFAMLRNIAFHYSGIILVPMTLVCPDYFHEFVTSLRNIGIPVHHFVLAANEKTLRTRLHKRLEGRHSWAAQQIPLCLTGFENPVFYPQIKTDGRSVDAIVEEIASQAGLTLIPSKTSVVRRLAITLRNLHQ